MNIVALMQSIGGEGTGVLNLQTMRHVNI